MLKTIVTFSLMTTLAILSGCSQVKNTTTEKATPKVDSPYIAKVEPAGALPVGESRTSAKTDEEIVIVGRIGGSANPFVEGLAAFTIVDPKVPYCAADEGCPTPWDYCCEQNAVKGNIATIKVVDQSGKVVTEDARTLLGVKELNEIVVHGKAKRDDEGNLSVMADQIFVK
ncbi:hypothetical protein [Lacunimicrobium album]